MMSNAEPKKRFRERPKVKNLVKYENNKHRKNTDVQNKLGSQLYKTYNRGSRASKMIQRALTGKNDLDD